MIGREFLKVLWQDYRAWRRGLKRIVPRRGVNGVVTRGRVYGPKNVKGDEVWFQHQARAKAVATIEAKLMRTDGSVEYHRVGGHVIQGD